MVVLLLIVFVAGYLAIAPDLYARQGDPRGCGPNTGAV